MRRMERFFKEVTVIKRKGLVILLCIYLLMVFNITLFDRIPTIRHAMLTPFWEYREFLYGSEKRYFFQQISCNILMLVPLGFLIPAIFPKVGWRVIILCFMFSSAIELTQYYTALGLCEFDDVFNNTLGGVIGYFIYWAVMKFQKRGQNK